MPWGHGEPEGRLPTSQRAVWTQCLREPSQASE